MSHSESYPLRRYFHTRIMPGLFLFAAIAAGLTIAGARTLAESLYMENAVKRADIITRAVSGAAPDGWQQIMVEHRPLDTVAPAIYAKLSAEFDHEVEELSLDKMKAYTPGGHVLYATGQTPGGTVETGEALRRAITTLKPQLVEKKTDTTSQYEFYIPVLNERGQLLVVFELYEPTSHLDRILGKAVLPALVPTGLFILMIAGLSIVVARAQRHIDQRATQVAELSARLRSFVSETAVDAARGAAGGDIPSERVRLTLFFSDARDFTGYSENNPPERVVWFLNELMSIQVAQVHAYGGDVDKMIGDAVLARFKGEDAEARALAAARAVQDELAAAALPRPVGIGLYTGDVISGTIGAADRRDFTVIGDGVNVAARLCSAAGAGEIVIDSETLKAAGDNPDFDDEEMLSVKGRIEPVAIRRLRTTPTPLT